MLNLVESFVSIQGEGKYSGRLAVFFRFAGCNLRCSGFKCELQSPKTGEILIGCDTIKAVFTSHFKYIKIFDSKELLDRIPNFKSKPIVVITGGEPLLYYDNDIFYDFIKKLICLGYEVHFETNGTVFVKFDKFEFYKKCIFCISPKLSLSGEKKEKRLKFDVLKNIKNNAKDSFYKFVVSKEFEIKDEILEILQNVNNEVYCMPLGKNKAELEKNTLFTLNFCITNGYNYSDRLHIRIWNDKDGV